MATPIYQLKITLRRTKPPIWRRVQVPANFTLDMLHRIIQAVMPWYGGHLHHFQQGETYFGIPEQGDDWFVYVDSDMTQIGEVLTHRGSRLMYEYDFGDSWEHNVALEKIMEPQPDTLYPVCTGGARACPPEDSGGVYGYAEMLQVLADPNHPDHDMYLEWLGGEWDAEAFDLELTNRILQARMRSPDSYPF